MVDVTRRFAWQFVAAAWAGMPAATARLAHGASGHLFSLAERAASVIGLDNLLRVALFGAKYANASDGFINLAIALKHIDTGAIPANDLLFGTIDWEKDKNAYRQLIWLGEPLKDLAAKGISLDDIQAHPQLVTSVVRKNSSYEVLGQKSTPEEQKQFVDMILEAKSRLARVFGDSKSLGDMVAIVQERRVHAALGAIHQRLAGSGDNLEGHILNELQYIADHELPEGHPHRVRFKKLREEEQAGWERQSQASKQFSNAVKQREAKLNNEGFNSGFCSIESDSLAFVDGADRLPEALKRGKVFSMSGRDILATDLHLTLQHPSIIGRLVSGGLVLGKDYVIKPYNDNQLMLVTNHPDLIRVLDTHHNLEMVRRPGRPMLDERVERTTIKYVM